MEDDRGIAVAAVGSASTEPGAISVMPGNGAVSPSAIVSAPVIERHPSAYTSYASRWFVLLTAATLNLTNAMVWLSFAEVVDETKNLFGISSDQVDWFSIIFFVSGLPLILPMTYALDSKGIRICLIGAAWCNAIGASLRAGGAYLALADYVGQGAYAMALTGQALASLAQPVATSIGTKIAAQWFPDNQRAVANALITLANTMGMLIANASIPSAVDSKASIPKVLLVIAAACFFNAVMATLGVRSSRPPTPPSASAAVESTETFGAGLKRLLTNKPFWILMMTGGGGLGIFSALQSLLQQILCIKGFPNEETGWIGAGMILSGVALSLVVGAIVDRTRKLEEAAKICYAFAVVGLNVFLIAADFHRATAMATIGLCLFGGFGLALYPVILELGVEATFPTPEATSSGLIFLTGQLLGLLCMLLSSFIVSEANAFDQHHQKCQSSNGKDLNDYLNFNILICVLAAVICVSFILFFKATYLRQEEQNPEKNKSTTTNTKVVAISITNLNQNY